jgi:formamidopyrimidine-DNA glycosylase
MPELPEVEQVRRTLSPKLVGQTVSSVRIFYPERIFDVTPVQFRRGIVDSRVKKLSRRGKYLLVQTDHQHTALIGLGMTGRFIVESGLEPLEYLVVAFNLKRNRVVKLYDMRRFSRISLAETSKIKEHPFLAHLGYEFDDKQLTPNVLRKELQRFRKRNIKSVLLDQGVIAGLGNIYTSEVLFGAKLNPEREAHTLNVKECSVLLGTIRKILRKAIEMGGTTVRDFRDADGKSGRYAKELKVYLREGQACTRCGKPSEIRRIVLGGRSTFYCPRCQK